MQHAPEGRDQATLNVSIAASTGALLLDLRKGELDIVVINARNAPPEGIARESLWDDEFVIYASARHRLAQRKSVVLADLVHERWALTAASGYLAELAAAGVRGT
jgi:DNA-binding transcriptional LysR family regulator